MGGYSVRTVRGTVRTLGQSRVHMAGHHYSLMAQVDAVDLVFAGLAAHGKGSYVRPPAVINQNAQGMGLISPEDFTRAAIQFQDQYRRLDFISARQSLEMLERTVQVEKISVVVREVIYPRLLIAVGAPHGTPIPELIARLYAAYANSTPAEMMALASNTVGAFDAKWKEVAADEDALTPEILKNFYEGMPFPIGCTFRKINLDNYQLAAGGLPFWAAAHLKPKAAFDFGGNSGLMTTLMAAAGTERCLLLDFSAKLLDFARWRDQRMGLNGIQYLELDASAASLPTQLMSMPWMNSLSILRTSMLRRSNCDKDE